MSKARARERAKAKAAKGAQKPKTATPPAQQKSHPGQFDAGQNSAKGPGMHVNTKNVSTTKRGSARSN